ncbi:MAG: hypothetical protein R2788_26020 [Saprospiraceae bacterium]
MYESSSLSKRANKPAQRYIGLPHFRHYVRREGAEDLKETRLPNPLFSPLPLLRLKWLVMHSNQEAVIGHSLGEFSALVAAGAMSFPDGLQLVQQRAVALQKLVKQWIQHHGRRAWLG